MPTMNQTDYGAAGRTRISTSSLARAIMLCALLMVGLFRGPLDILRFLAAPVAEGGRAPADVVEAAADVVLAVALCIFLAGHARDTMGRYRGTPIASVLSSPFTRGGAPASAPPQAAEPTDEELMAAAAAGESPAAEPAAPPSTPTRPLSARMRGWMGGARATLTASRHGGRRADPDVPLQLPPPTEGAGKDGVN
jgi:hypothetical protein